MRKKVSQKRYVQERHMRNQNNINEFHPRRSKVATNSFIMNRT